MNNVIIYGPPRHHDAAQNEALCAHYGMERVIDEAYFFDNHTKKLTGNLILSTKGDATWRHFGRLVPLAMALQEAGIEDTKERA